MTNKKHAGAKNPAVCAHCGASVAGRPFLREGTLYCCEGCFLDRLEHGGARTSQALLAEALAAALDLREHETGLHSKRVACHTLVLAMRHSTEVGFLQQIYWGALLHDIGKIGVSDAVLLKHGGLTDTEWREMRTHPDKGYEILAPLPGLADAAHIVRAHEERFDGSGYPQGLAGEEIPLGARLFAVIDTLDAITSDRPYRHAQSFDHAAGEILAASGTQFDPQAVRLFVAEEAALRRMVDAKCTRLEDAVEADPRPAPPPGR